MAELHQRFFRLRESDGVFIIDIVGEPGSLSGEAMNRQLELVLDQLTGKAELRVVVDFQQAPYFGSSLLEDLLRIWRIVHDGHGTLVLCNLSPTGRELIDLARFERLWPIFPDCDSALAHYQNR
jgi:anti-anti-sigma factor